MKKILITESQRNFLLESIKERLAAERKKVDTNPTDAQCKAGNYAMGHVSINGFEITIENPKGSYRRGRDKSGKAWKTYMHNDYGYFTKTVGKDGDAIDVFLGPYLDDKIEDAKIYPIDQYVNGEFDETKVMMGFRSKEEAKKAYLSNYEKDWKGFKYITEVDIETFKKWLYDGYRQRKPFAKYVSLTESKEVLNNEGQVVPDKCDKCGGEIVLQIHGEPIYICKKCGKYFGTMPFSKNLDESKKKNPPKNEVAAINKANRDDDINAHGKSIAFRQTITKNPKAYSRKEGKKVNLDKIIEEEIEKSIKNGK